MSNQFIGEVRLFPYNFAPRTWAYCAGQQLSIQQNSALFSLLGTTYGGNGVTTFALPDLRGRAVNSSGNSNYGQSYVQGQVAGTETVTLIASQLPFHNHMWLATSDAANAPRPEGNTFGSGRLAGGVQPAALYAPSSAGANVPLAPTTLGLTGGNQPHPNMQPYLVLAYCIALQGIFPSRN